MSTIILKRISDDGKCTLGEMLFPDGTTFKTVELPWKNNQQRVSCIPEGEYKLVQRLSPIVERTSKGRYRMGWEVTNVPNRTFIMIHIGNSAKDFLGCIGVGTGYGSFADSKGVTNSRVAFNTFMEKMKTSTNWTLKIVRV